MPDQRLSNVDPDGNAQTINAGTGAILLLLAGGIALVVKLASGPKKGKKTRKVFEFNNKTVSKGEYNRDADNFLRFVTATVAEELKRLCAAGNAVSWDDINNVLLQCPMLEIQESSKVFKTETRYVKDLKTTDKNTEMRQWMYEVVKSADADVFDVARLHEAEFNDIINTSLGDIDNDDEALDIGIIRFPTKVLPYVKVYRLLVSSMIGHVSVEIHSVKYYPKIGVLSSIPAETVVFVNKKFEHMLV